MRPLHRLVAKKLGLHTALSGDVQEALANFLGPTSEFAAGALIARAGEPAGPISILADGVACRMTILPDGGRQIHSILLQGDAADAEASLLAVRSDSIQAITPCVVWSIPKARFAALPHTSPGLAEAFLREATITAEITREWLVNLGRRSATQRIAHLISEICTRIDAMGGADDGEYPFPLTQQDLADALGLSSVHVNRVLQHLRGEGLLQLRGKRLKVLDRERLEAMGEFDPGYLHFSNAKAA